MHAKKDGVLDLDPVFAFFFLLFEVADDAVRDGFRQNGLIAVIRQFLQFSR